MADTKSGFSADERAAMKQRAEELRATKGLKGAAKLAKELEACVEAIEALTGVDGDLARAVHRIVGDVAPHALQLAVERLIGGASVVCSETGGAGQPAVALFVVRLGQLVGAFEALQL